MNRRHTLGLGLTLALQGAVMASNQFLGGNSLFHTWTGHNLEPGQLTVQWHSRAWSGNVGAGSISNVSQALAMNFGFSKHLEIEVAPVFYQDLNLSSQLYSTYNAPDDLMLRFRFGGHEARIGSMPLQWGVQLSGRVDASKYSNVYLEPYSLGSNELELGGAVSWFANPAYPMEGNSAHLNLNYINHNDGGEAALNVFSDVTHDLEFSLAYRRPTLKWEWFGELHGNVFLVDPPASAFTRADVVWLQPGVTRRLFYGLSLTAALDVRLLESGPELHVLSEGPVPAGTKSEQIRLNSDYPEYYSPWRASVKLAFQPSTAFRHVDTFAEVKPQSERDWEMRQKIGVTEREMIDWLGTEDQSAEFLDLELEKIRKERQRAEKELERLKEKLKDDKGK